MAKYLLPGNSTDQKFLYYTAQDPKIIKEKGFVEVSDEDAKKLLLHEKCWSDDKTLIKFVPTPEEEKKQRNLEREGRNTIRQSKIEGHKIWFTKYDTQVAEYNRAIRLGQEPDIHIGDKKYASIAELDADAVIHSDKIKKYRSEMEPFEK